MDLLPAVGATPLLLPVAGVVLLLGVVLARPLGRGLRCRPPLAAALVASAGLVLAATLTPGLGETFTQGSCLAGLDGSLSGFDWFVADVGRNLLLTLPLGFCTGLLRPPVRGRAVVTAAVVLPLVEVVQLVVPALGRACQVTDMAANGAGLLVGVAVGVVVGWLAR